MYIPRPPEHIFENRGNPGHGQTVRIIKEILYPESGGIEVWYKDQPYPKKGFPYPEAVMSSGHLKRGAMAALRMLSFKASPLNAFLDFAENCLHDHFLDPQRYNAALREIYRAGIEVSKNERQKLLVRIFCQIFQDDNAYCLRLQDVSEVMTRQGFIKDPKGELIKALKAGWERDFGPNDDSQRKKWELIIKAVPYLFLIPSFRRFIKDFAKEVDLQRLWLDEADYYWCAERIDYNFRGKPMNVRQKEVGYKVNELYRLIGGDGIEIQQKDKEAPNDDQRFIQKEKDN